jgi:hypothetical protein
MMDWWPRCWQVNADVDPDWLALVGKRCEEDFDKLSLQVWRGGGEPSVSLLLLGFVGFFLCATWNGSSLVSEDFYNFERPVV